MVISVYLIFKIFFLQKTILKANKLKSYEMVPYIDQYTSNQILIKVKDQHNDWYSIFDSWLKSIIFFHTYIVSMEQIMHNLYVKLLLSQLKQIMLAMKVFSSHQLFCTQIFVGGKHMCSCHMFWCAKSMIMSILHTWLILKDHGKYNFVRILQNSY